MKLRIALFVGLIGCGAALAAAAPDVGTILQRLKEEEEARVRDGGPQPKKKPPPRSAVP